MHSLYHVFFIIGYLTPQCKWFIKETLKVIRSETPWSIVLMHPPWYNSYRFIIWKVNHESSLQENIRTKPSWHCIFWSCPRLWTICKFSLYSNYSRGVHGSVQVGFMPNPRPTRWHQVANEKTHCWPQKPTSQVGSNSVGWQLGQLKLKRCYQRFKLAATTCFFSWIFIGFEQNH